MVGFLVFMVFSKAEIQPWAISTSNSNNIKNDEINQRSYEIVSTKITSKDNDDEDNDEIEAKLKN